MKPDRGPDVLEASKYIEAFRDRLVVVKLGGELLDGGPVLERILPQIVVLVRCGLRPLIVHGGGKQIDAECAKRGIVQRKVHGRRVTDDATLDVLTSVVGGDLNKAIVERLRRDGVPAVGFADGVTQAVRCVQRPSSVIAGEQVDWGWVGDVVDIDVTKLSQGASGWSVPVLPSLGTLADGHLVNVNGDAVASRVASDLSASKLVLLTSIAGVMRGLDAAGPISELSVSAVRELIAHDVIKGGMRAKVEEALKAIDRGVERVHIISGREPATLLREIFSDDGCGTLVVPDGAAAS